MSEFVIDVPAGFASVLREAAVHELVEVWGPPPEDDPDLSWTDDDLRQRVEMLADWTRLKVELDAHSARVDVSRALAGRILEMYEDDDGCPTGDLLEAVPEAQTRVEREQALDRLRGWIVFVNAVESELRAEETPA